MKERLDYARICIEMNAGSSSPRFIVVRQGEGFTRVPVEYPWRLVSCKHCVEFGHHSDKFLKKERERISIYQPKKTSLMGNKGNPQVVEK